MECMDCKETFPKNDMIADPANGSGLLCRNCITHRLFPMITGSSWEPPCVVPVTEYYSESAKQMIPTGERTVGIEIEGAWSIPATFKLRAMLETGKKKDGSLRGADSFEAVSNVLKSSNYTEWLAEIPWEGLNGFSRAGIHAWFGTQDLTWTQIQNILYFCAIRQSEFSSLVSPTRKLLHERDKSGRPMKITWPPRIYRTKAGFLRSLYGWNSLRTGGSSRMQASKRANDSSHSVYNGPINRTWWLNIHGHYTSRKAIEVRLLHTTNIPEVVEAWIELWLTVISKVKDMSQSEMRSTDLRKLAPRRCKVLWNASAAGYDILTQQKGYVITRRSALYSQMGQYIKAQNK